MQPDRLDLRMDDAALFPMAPLGSRLHDMTHVLMRDALRTHGARQVAAIMRVIPIRRSPFGHPHRRRLFPYGFEARPILRVHGMPVDTAGISCGLIALASAQFR